MKIEAFCTAATCDMKLDLELFLVAINKVHPGIPVYVLCDQETVDHINEKECPLEHVTIELFNEAMEREAREATANTRIHNHFHPPEKIYMKLFALDIPFRHGHNSAFFLDADIVPVKPLHQEGIRAPIVVCPHYYTKDVAGRCQKAGLFNAGYVWTSLPELGPFWRSQYASGESTYYEQKGMEMWGDKWPIDFFGPEHNYGMWRHGPSVHTVRTDVKSWHVHFVQPGGGRYSGKLARRKAFHLRDSALEDIARKQPEVAARARKIMGAQRINIPGTPERIVQAPSRVLHVHYGKAGGSYVNRYFGDYILGPYGYKSVCPWDIFPPGHVRDFTEAELCAIADGYFVGLDENDLAYCHCHHINMTAEAIETFALSEWFSFMFLRQPHDVIASLYFWGKDEIREKGKNSIFDSAPPDLWVPDEIRDLTIDFDGFVRFIMDHGWMSQLWTLPPWIDKVSYVAENTPKKLLKFFKNQMGHIYKKGRIARANTSSNPGFKNLIEQGAISEETLEKLLLHPEYVKYGNYIWLRPPTVEEDGEEHEPEQE